MKRILLIFVLGVLSFHIWAQKKSSDKGHRITVSVKNFPDTNLLILGNYFGDKTYIIDTGKYDKKTKIYAFSDTAKLYRGIYFLVHKQAKVVEFAVSDNQNFEISFDFQEPYKSLVFKNSQENTDFADFQKQQNELYPKGDELYKQLQKCDSIPNCDSAELHKELRSVYKALTDGKINFVQQHPGYLMTKVLLASKDIEIPTPPQDLKTDEEINEYRYQYYKTHYFDNIDLKEDGLVRSPVFHDKVAFYFDKMIHPNPDSVNKAVDEFLTKIEHTPEMYKYCLWYLCNKYERSNRITDDAVFVHIVREYYAKGKAPWTGQSTVKALVKRADELEPILIGKKAPDFACPDTNENWISLYSIRSKYTVLIFWATDCGVCKTEIPKLKAFYDANKKLYDFEVYAVDTKSNKNEWKQMIRSMGLNWINVNGTNSNLDWFNIYDAHSTPAVYVLDKNKKIVLKKVGGESIEDYLKIEGKK